MGWLESVLHEEGTAATCGAHHAGRFHLVGVGTSGALFESAVAFVSEEEQPNPLLSLASAYDVPEGYGSYPGSSIEDEDEGSEDEPFSLNVPPEIHADFQ